MNYIFLIDVDIHDVIEPEYTYVAKDGAGVAC